MCEIPTQTEFSHVWRERQWKTRFCVLFLVSLFLFVLGFGLFIILKCMYFLLNE